MLSRDVLLDRVWGVVVSRRHADGRRPRRPASPQARPPRADPHAARQRLQGGRRLKTLRGRLFAATLAALGADPGADDRDRRDPDPAAGRQGAGERARPAGRQRRARRAASRSATSTSTLVVGRHHDDRRPIGPSFAGVRPGRQPVEQRHARPTRASGTSTRTGRSRRAGCCCSAPSSAKSAAWHPFLGDLLLAALAGAALAAVLSFAGRPLDRPARAPGRRREPRARRRRDADAAARGGCAASSPRSRRRSTRWPQQLAASRDSERNFLLSVSHELKTPLTAIRGYAEGLARGRLHARRGLADDPRRVAPARAPRARPARPRADEPPRVLGRPRGRSSLAERRPRRGRPPRGVGPGVRRRRSPPRATRRGSRPTTTACSRSPRTWSRTRCARRRPAGSVTVRADAAPAQRLGHRARASSSTTCRTRSTASSSTTSTAASARSAAASASRS